MQRAETILGIIEMRMKQIPYQLCQERFGIGSSVVTNVMKQYRLLGRSLEDLKALQPDELEQLFFPPERRRRRKAELPDFDAIYQRLHAKNSRLNVYMMWEEYHEKEPDGYGYTQFLKYYQEHIAAIHGSCDVKMIVRRIPGERMFVDWMGDTPLLLRDAHTGELKSVHIFCATLGVSSIGYAEVFENEKLESFILGIVHVLNYFGGVPRYIVPDNLRAAVTKNTKDGLNLTQACRDLEEYYGTVFLPPPPAKPTAKGTVEKYVRDMESHLVEPLKGASYTSVSEIMSKAAPIVEAFNCRVGRGRTESRRDIFERLDKPMLEPLPADTFTLWDYAVVPKVPATYHVTYDHHRYSVPYKMAGRPAMIRASLSNIQVTDDHNVIVAQHKRSYAEYPKEITNPEHMPPHHRFYADVNASDGSLYREWAESVGEATLALVEHILAAGSHEEQMYRSCMSLMLHAREVSPQIVERAARACLDTEKTVCSDFEKAITNLANAPDQTNGKVIQAHSNIRGKEYFA